MTAPVRVGLKLSPQATTIADLRAVWQIADHAAVPKPSGTPTCWRRRCSPG